MTELHPVLAARDKAFRADPRMRGLLTINNTVRSREQQIALWDGYQAKLKWANEHPWLPNGMNPYRNFNTAANPYAVFQGAYDVSARYGSWHMEQFSQDYQKYFGYAIDYNYSALPQDIKKIFISVAAEYMLIETVKTPQYEPWHYQMMWGDWTTIPFKPTPNPPKEWDEMASKEDFKDAVREVLDERGLTEAKIDDIHSELVHENRDGQPTVRNRVNYIDAQVRGVRGRTLNVLLESNIRWAKGIAAKVGATQAK